MPKHNRERICPCEFCKATRNYRSLRPGFETTALEKQHDRKIIRREAFQRFRRFWRKNAD